MLNIEWMKIEHPKFTIHFVDMHGKCTLQRII